MIVLEWFAIVFTATALVPGGAHLFERAPKLELAQGEYMAVQGLYHGWNWFGVELIAALLFNALAAVAARDRPLSFWASLAGFMFLGATLAVFFLRTERANRATADWTVAPPDWRAQRTLWEDSQALGAVLTFLALCSATLAGLAYSASC